MIVFVQYQLLFTIRGIPQIFGFVFIPLHWHWLPQPNTFIIIFNNNCLMLFCSIFDVCRAHNCVRTIQHVHTQYVFHIICTSQTRINKIYCTYILNVYCTRIDINTPTLLHIRLFVINVFFSTLCCSVSYIYTYISQLSSRKIISVHTHYTK